MLFYENRSLKSVKEFFQVVKINLRRITKNHAADPEIGFLKKSIVKKNELKTAKF